MSSTRPPTDERPSTDRLGPLEVASGVVWGPDETTSSLGRVPRSHRDPIAAMEDVILPALQRPPCLVSFSGGRDSSAVLAVATGLARREGLPLPVPATLRFPKVASVEESEWQERVIGHLHLEEWLRLEFDDELDAVGPVATQILRRHGLLWPFNTFFHVPIFQAASGGSVLTGVGGDEVLATVWPLGVAWGMATKVVPMTYRRVKGVGVRLAVRAMPRPVRRQYHKRHLRLTWLRPEAHRAFSFQFADWYAKAPVRFDTCLRRWFWPSRYLQVVRRSVATVAAPWDVQVVHPLSEPDVLAVISSHMGARGFAARRHAMRLLFSDLLPEEVLARPNKVVFNEVFANTHTRAFVAQWGGAGVDSSLVFPEALRQTWASPCPDGRSMMLLHAAWLAAGAATPPGNGPTRLPGEPPSPRRGSRAPWAG